MDHSQPTETGEPSPKQVEEIDLTFVRCLDDPQYKEDILTRPEEIHASLHQAVLNKGETSAEIEEDTSPTAPETITGFILTELDKEIDTSLSTPGSKNAGHASKTLDIDDFLIPKGSSMTIHEKATRKRKFPPLDTGLELRRSQRVAKRTN